MSKACICAAAARAQRRAVDESEAAESAAAGSASGSARATCRAHNPRDDGPPARRRCRPRSAPRRQMRHRPIVEAEAAFGRRSPCRTALRRARSGRCPRHRRCRRSRRAAPTARCRRAGARPRRRAGRAARPAARYRAAVARRTAVWARSTCGHLAGRFDRRGRCVRRQWHVRDLADRCGTGGTESAPDHRVHETLDVARRFIGAA
jgi:hypothetical protein